MPNTNLEIIQKAMEEYIYLKSFLNVAGVNVRIGQDQRIELNSCRW